MVVGSEECDEEGGGKRLVFTGTARTPSQSNLTLWILVVHQTLVAEETTPWVQVGDGELVHKP